MHLAAVRMEVHIPTSRSLKDKRGVVKPLVEGMRQRFGLSVAETAFQDKWQRAEIGAAVVSGSVAQVRQVVDELERWLWRQAEVEVSAFDVSWPEV
jgi:uncharacterized protein YlxP (DUF503 family)